METAESKKLSSSIYLCHLCMCASMLALQVLDEKITDIECKTVKPKLFPSISAATIHCGPSSFTGITSSSPL